MSIDKIIKEVQDVNSDHRIGQAICNSLGITCPELYYIKDYTLLERLNQYSDMVKKLGQNTKDGHN